MKVTKGRNVVVVGTQWGDEGKGKLVDWLTESAQGVVDAFSGPGMGAAAKRNFMTRLRELAAYDTLPEAKAAQSRSSWGDFLRRCRALNINPVTLPAEWGIDTLPNPRP